MVELQIEFFYVFRLFFNDKMRSLEVKTGMWKFIHAKYIDSQLYWKHPRKKFPPISFYKNHDSLGMGSKFYANFQCDLFTPSFTNLFTPSFTLSFILSHTQLSLGIGYHRPSNAFATISLFLPSFPPFLSALLASNNG